MGHRTTKTKSKVKVPRTIESRTEFFYYAFRNILIVNLPIFVVVALILSLPHSSAAVNSAADNVTINLPTSCTLSGNVTAEHTNGMVSGQ